PTAEEPAHGPVVVMKGGTQLRLVELHGAIALDLDPHRSRVTVRAVRECEGADRGLQVVEDLTRRGVADEESARLTSGVEGGERLDPVDRAVEVVHHLPDGIHQSVHVAVDRKGHLPDTGGMEIEGDTGDQVA